MRSSIKKEHDLIMRVAWKYHKEGLTQKEIADIMDISRFKVMDLLSQAKEEGIIDIRINSPIYNCLSKEQSLRDKFSLEDAYVIPEPEKEKNIKKVIGLSGSDYLEEIIDDGDMVGTAWGETLFEVAKNFKGMNESGQNTSFILMLGGLGSEQAISLNPYDVAKTLADKLGGRCYYIFSPAVVETEKAKEIIMADDKIRSALEKARSADKALVGIGEVSRNATLVETGFISRSEIKNLKQKGAVGDILGRFFDINGEPVESNINDLIVGLNLEEIKNSGKVIGFAGGENKVKSIYGALQGEYLDVLVTDENTASKLINFAG